MAVKAISFEKWNELSKLNAGDNIFDVCFAYKESNTLFGQVSICGIAGRERASEIAEDLSRQSGVEVVVEKVHMDNF